VPNEIGALGVLAAAYRALGRYEEALPLYERVDADDRADEVACGHPGRQKDISCIYWVLGDRAKSIHLMRTLVEGVLDGTIEFGDAAGGVQQGLLLYYMAVTMRDSQAATFAVDYMRNRARRSAIQSWPGPVARHYLGEVNFPSVLSAATGAADVESATSIARSKLLSRRRLCAALFHDEVRSRAEGAEQHCRARMRDCYQLEDPLIEVEWYLARHEVEQADQIKGARI